jgi:hypothetical protein
MNPRPLSFAHLVKVLEFNQVAFVTSPPAHPKHPYFVGPLKDPAFFPYATGPVKYLDRAYEMTEMLPVRFIHSVIKHLQIDPSKFWKDAEAVAAQVPAKTAQQFATKIETAEVEVKATRLRD